MKEQTSSYLFAIWWLAVTDSDNYDSCEWISSQWLSKWMSVSNECDVPPIDNSQLCCRHERSVSNQIKLGFIKM